ncbi:hypothetical protein ACIGT4_14270 [Streptomyces sioyaensis]|uniref:hypothetical protein n=1 Tax=Streptomyces sioyaensis TaxID=67364 RepID=UPI0037CD2210
MDAEGMSRKHKCDFFSTAFNHDQGEAFMHADLRGRSQLDPHKTDGQYIRFQPEDAWGPGSDHHERFRDFYIDPKNPVDQASGSINCNPVDFRGAGLLAIYDPDGRGGYKLVTMYPEPERDRNT